MDIGSFRNQIDNRALSQIDFHHAGNSGGPVYFISARTHGGSRKVREASFIAGLVITQAVVEGRSLDLAAVIPAQFIREAIDARPLAGGPR